ALALRHGLTAQGFTVDVAHDGPSGLAQAMEHMPHGDARPELHQGGAELTLSALYGGAGLLFLALAGQRCRGPAGGGQAVTNE
ncbi:hypothetical protein ACLMMR_41415, partial [Streptomyces sp. NPDC000405]